MYSMLINPNYIINTKSEEISHTNVEFNFTINAEFDLFIFMVLTNRPSLARLFWIRDGRKRTATMFQSALLACLICRGLIKLPCVSQHYHLVNAFEHISNEYEDFVAKVFKQAHQRNAERTLSAMALKFQQCKMWNSLDLIVQADCRKVVESCDSLCIEAVKRRFFGTYELSSSISRLALAWSVVIEEFNVNQTNALSQDPSQTTQNNGCGPGSQDSKKYRRRSISQHFSTEFDDDKKPLNVWAFFLCVVVDMLGVIQIIFPVFPPTFVMLFAPLTGILVYYNHRFAPLALICVLAECIPFLHLLPSATMTWWWMESSRWMDRDAKIKADEAAHRIFLPIDYFIVDVLSHLIVTSLITGFMLMEQSAISTALEALIVLLLLADEIPDVLFAGVRKDSPSMLSVVIEGFVEYISATG